MDSQPYEFNYIGVNDNYDYRGYAPLASMCPYSY